MGWAIAHQNVKLRVLMGFRRFGKLCKLIMQFSSTWKVLEKEVFQNGNGKFLDFVLGNSRIS